VSGLTERITALRGQRESGPLQPSKPPACSSNGQAKEAMASSG